MRPLSDEELLARLHEVDVPEPSPLFWDHLSQRVHDAVAAEPVPSLAWSSRFNFAWAGGMVALAVVAALAVTLSVRHQPGPGQLAKAVPVVADGAAVGNVLPALDPLDALDALDNDASWAVMGELASEMDFDEAGSAGLTVTPGAADGALSQLSGDEQRAVVVLLQQEIQNPKSL